MSLTLKSSKVEVAAATMAELVEFVNAHSGKAPIKKFETRAKGVERVNALIAAQPASELAPGAAKALKEVSEKAERPAPAKKPEANTAAAQMARVLTAQVAHPSTAKPAAKTKPAEKKAQPKSTGGGRAHFTTDAVITIVHKGDNPKKGTAADRFALYRNGMTVAAYIAAGGQRRDVVWDQKMGWIKTAEPK